MTEALPDDLIRTLETVSTATVTTLLLKKGLRTVWMQGPMPYANTTNPDGTPKRLVGRAFTLRFVPAREDLATPAAWASPISTRAAIEAMPEGAIVVADARGVTSAGIFGDILCARMVKRGVKALITDGVVRDGTGVAATGLPVWSAGTAAPPSVAGLTFVGWNEAIGCGGVAVFANDLLIVDADGAVVVPADYIELVAKEGPEQERFEAWVQREVEAGHPLPGLYPPDAATRARYDATR